MKKNPAVKNNENSLLPAWRAVKMLEEKLGYEFKNPEFIERAMIHSSWANEHSHAGEHNERLEFLGDAVLELCISNELFHRFPNAREGSLTQIRSELVNETTLASLAKELGIDRALRLGKGEESQDGRRKASLLADALEAVFAAVFLDGDFLAAKSVILALYEPHWPQSPNINKQKDAKSSLQEVCQKEYGVEPVYQLLEIGGPQHERQYKVAVTLPDGQVFQASETAQKRAEQAAAAIALAALAEKSKAC